jgi:hypothetical protein
VHRARRTSPQIAAPVSQPAVRAAIVPEACLYRLCIVLVAAQIHFPIYRHLRHARLSGANLLPNTRRERVGEILRRVWCKARAGGCPKCGSPIIPGARFCNACGTQVADGASANACTTNEITRARPTYGATPGGAGGAQGDGVASEHALTRYAPWAFAVVLLIAVGSYFAGRNGANSNGAAEATAGAAPVASGMAGAPAGAVPLASGARAPDISSMTPREQAGRLHDRIMRYAKEGKDDSAAFFAPMAMQSFEMLGPNLDAGTRYDYGRVATETGAFDVAQAQADTILKQSPTHLLGLVLAARNAAKRGDPSGAAKYWKAFAAAKGSELKKALPEYVSHTADIESGAGVLAPNKQM